MTRRVNKIIWVTGLSLSTLATTVLITALTGRTNLAQGCSNFWVNPRTGDQECLDSLSSPAGSPAAGPQGKFVPGQVIVGIRNNANTSRLATTAQTLGGVVKKTIPGPGGALLLEFSSEGRAQTAIPRLQGMAGVAFVERNEIISLPPQPQLPPLPSNLNRLGTGREVSQRDIEPQAVSNDPATGHQWHLTVIRKTAALPALAANPPTVAVIDSGVDYTHPDLTGKVLLGLNTLTGSMDPFDDNGHGTHVAGLIAARAGNSTYGEGVSPNSRVLAVKVCGDIGCPIFEIALGMAYARTWTPPAGVAPARVINMSLGGSGVSALISAQVDEIKNAGKVLVASAGNSNSSTTPSYPAAYPNTALRVMATEQQDCRAYFSNFSPASNPNLYNIAAPGWNTPSTLPDGGFGPLSGTSMASPIVAGAAALVWGQSPGLTRDQLVNRLVSTAQPVNCGFSVATRRVDVRRAIAGGSETALLGRLHDPFSGKAPSPNTLPSLARLFNGGTPVAGDQTNRSGFYEMVNLGAGARNLRGERSAAPPYGGSAILRNLGILTGRVNGPFTDAIPLRRATGNATITLDWKNIHPALSATGCTSTISAPGSCLGWEFDLYVKTPAGAYVGYGQGSLVSSPFVRSGRDSWNDLDSPTEGVVIGNNAANGTYIVFVDKWLTNSSGYFNKSYTGSQASVQMYNGAAAIGTFYAAPPAGCGTSRFWYVGRLVKNGSNYTWQNQNTCSNTVP